MKTVTKSQLGAIIQAQRGAVICTLDTLTDARLKKTGNPLASVGVLKASRVNGILNFEYEDAVNRQQGREGGPQDFTVSARKWGTPLPGARWMIEHQGRLYVQLKVERATQKPRYMRADNHRYIAAATVKPFLPKKYSSAEAQGVEREVVVRDYALDSVRVARIGGEVYRVRG